ncbi:MAG: NEW3 domain-containing protein [Thermoplasmatota archaeon]
MASNDESLIALGRLTIGTQQNGITQRIEFQGQSITAFAASDDGSKIAVATRNAFNQFNLSLYHWTGSNPGNVVSQWSREIDGAAGLLDVNSEGNGALAYGDVHVRFTATGTLHERTLDANVASLDYGPGYWSLAGLDEGQIIAFGPNSNQAPYAQEFEFHPFDDEITAVSWLDKKSFYVGDADGRLSHYWNIEEALTADELIWTQSMSPIRAIDAKGEYLAVLTSTDVRMKDLEGVSYWVREGVGTQLGLSESGYASIATSAGVIPFGAVFASDILVPKYVIPTGGKQSKSVVIENTGNRPQTFSVDALLDAGWTSVPVDPVSLQPGASAPVALELQSPGLVGAGIYLMELQVVSDGQALRTFELNITVPSQSNWDLVADGASTIGVNGGEVARFPFHVANNGNDARTPVLELSTLSTWPAQIDAEWPLMPPQSSSEGELVVTVPANAAEGAEATFFVEIPGHDSLEFQVVVGANYGVLIDVPTLIPAFEAGTEVSALLVVENTGNGVDNFKLQWSGTPADWIIEYDQSLLLSIGAGSSAEVPIAVKTSETAAPGTYQARLHVHSISDPRFFDENTVLFVVEEPEIEEPEDNESPFVFPALVLGLLVLARRNKP